MRLLRRDPDLQIAEPPAAAALAWAAHGYLRRDDLCAQVGVGTLAVGEVPALGRALREGDLRRFRTVGAGATLLLGAAALTRGEPSLAPAIVGLLVLGQVALFAALTSTSARLDRLPRETAELARFERQRVLALLGTGLAKAAKVLLIASVAALPGTAQSLAFSLSGLAAGLVALRLRRA